MSGLKKLAIPLIILAFPVVLWILITRGHNRFRELPVFGPIDIAANGDTVYHTIPAFTFTDQTGKKVSSADLENKIYVVNFFFATCKTVCPKMNDQVARLQGAIKDQKDVQILSFTVDPENDSVEALAKYADKYRADPNVWHFLTGNKDSIYNLAREGFLLPAAERQAENDFFHSQDLILIDKQKRIRGIYDGMEKAEVDTLVDEIKLLLVTK
jgi:protein SCO1